MSCSACLNTPFNEKTLKRLYGETHFAVTRNFVHTTHACMEIGYIRQWQQANNHLLETAQPSQWQTRSMVQMARKLVEGVLVKQFLGVILDRECTIWQHFHKFVNGMKPDFLSNTLFGFNDTLMCCGNISLLQSCWNNTTITSKN